MLEVRGTTQIATFIAKVATPLATTKLNPSSFKQLPHYRGWVF